MAIALWGDSDDRLRWLRGLELQDPKEDPGHRFSCSPAAIAKEQRFPQPGDRCSRCGERRERHKAAYAFGPAPLDWLLCYVMNEHLDRLRREQEWEREPGTT